jgi:prevent-host-death family protein
MKTIPQRELRNNITRVLREVEAGEHIRITVNGRPVADLVPVEEGYPRTFVPAEVSDRMLRDRPVDPDFYRDIEFVTEQTADEMRWPPEMKWPPKQDS